MTQKLERIVYVSVAHPGLGETDLVRLIDVSQSNNYERFITGYLVLNDGQFMQLIEGPPDEVAALYASIQADPRHTGVVTLLREPVTQRSFPDWSMNFFRVDDARRSGAMLARQDDPVDSLMTPDAPRELIFLFSKFIRQSPVAPG